MVLGRHTRFWQSSRVNELRVVKPSIDEGNSFIAVSLKSRSLRPLRFPRFSGKLSKFEHPQRLRCWSEFKLQMLLGRHIRFEQEFRLRRTSFLRSPTDGWSSRKFWQYESVNFSRFRTPVKSGDIIRPDFDKSMNFNLSKFCFKKEKKKVKKEVKSMSFLVSDLLKFKCKVVRILNNT